MRQSLSNAIADEFPATDIQGAFDALALSGNESTCLDSINLACKALTPTN
jgi:hypothetical protein